MEMEEIPKEQERSGRSEGEVETEHYSSLQSPSEDLYAEAKFLTDTSKTKTGGFVGVRLWKGVSLCLAVLCLILILAIVILLINRSPVAQCQETSPNAVLSKPLTSDFCKRCQSDHCAQDWLHYGESCFYMSALRETWDKAQKNCSELGGGLAVITTPSLQRFLTQGGKRREYWIGLRQHETWTWVNKQQLTKSYWSDTPTGGDCVTLMGNVSSEKSWFRRSCSRPIYYICEVPVSRK